MELPLAPDDHFERPERADAARNRLRILAAAERLFADNGVGCTSMDDVAREAGVGKGTLYRRFGDRSALVRSLISEREAAFQEQCIRGAPPLGPSAPPLERLLAFGHGVMDFLETHGELILAAESTMGALKRFNTKPREFQRVHLGILLEQIAPNVDTTVAAEALLAPLSADLYLYLRRAREVPREQLEAGWRQLVLAVVHAPER